MNPVGDLAPLDLIAGYYTLSGSRAGAGEGEAARVLPGEGSCDLVGFLRVLDAHGVTAPIVVEILSDEQNSRPVEEAARLPFAATRAVLARAGFRGAA